MAYGHQMLDRLKSEINPQVPCEVGRPKKTTPRPYVILNAIPMGINESGMRGGNGIQDMNITIDAIGENRAQAEAALGQALDVVASWSDPDLLGPPESTPSTHLPQEEGTWRLGANIRIRYQ